MCSVLRWVELFPFFILRVLFSFGMNASKVLESSESIDWPVFSGTSHLRWRLSRNQKLFQSRMCILKRILKLHFHSRNRLKMSEILFDVSLWLQIRFRSLSAFSEVNYIWNNPVENVFWFPFKRRQIFIQKSRKQCCVTLADFQELFAKIIHESLFIKPLIRS